MADDAPKDIDEAKARGFQILEESQIERNRFNDIVGGGLTPYLNCTPQTEGKACGEGPCLGGKKRIYFCTGNQCAYRYIEYNC